MGCEALFVGPHPDDVELFCGGTLLRLLDHGHRVAIVDLTRGEKGSRGDVATRTAECEAATRVLGLAAGDRRNLELPDTRLVDDDAMTRPLVQAIRDFRPRLLFAPHHDDIHPDHEATAGLAKRAWFLAGLPNYQPDLGRAFRPATLIRFPGNNHVEPSFCVDISDLEARKAALVECYASQVHLHADPTDTTGTNPAHDPTRLDPLERMVARDRYTGARVGVRAAEPFVLAGPLVLQDPMSVLA